MVGIDNYFMKRIVLIFFLFLFISFSLECSDYKYSFSLLPSEINYDYDKMIDAEQDIPSDNTSYMYSRNILEKEKSFLNTCNRISEDSSLIGEWKLIDSEGNKINKHSYYFNNAISIHSYNNELVLDNWGNRSILYLGDENRYYILSRGILIIRMIKIIDDNLYVYIVKDGLWALDSIHENGKYIFKKE